MKKILLALSSLIILVCLAQSSFAGTDAKAFFAGPKQASPISAGYNYPTDILIINDGYDDIHVDAITPFGSYSTTVYADDYVHFIHRSWDGMTEIVLADYYGYVFFDEFVANHATIRVSDPYYLSGMAGQKHHPVATVKQ